MTTDRRDGFVELCLLTAAVLLGVSAGRSAAGALDLAWWWELSVSIGVIVLVALVAVVLLASLGLLPPRSPTPPGPRSRSRRTAELLGLVEPAGSRRPRVRWTPARVGIFAAVVVATAVLAGVLRVGIDRVVA